MDSSALIFLALAVAWAAYLLPLALKHHEESARSRTVDRFSRSMRVLARREPVDKRTARLVSSERSAPAQQPAPAPEAPMAPAQLAAHRAAAKRATKRRRNVLAVLLLANLLLIGLAAFTVVAWPYVAIPAALLVAWLVACRLMVKGERKTRARRPALTPGRVPAPPAADPETVDETGEVVVVAEVAEPTGAAPGADPMDDTSANIAAVVDPTMWDPVPVTLPTYVSKPTAARRSVRTIDLDATGVWTSGRTDADAQLAREAEEADKAARRTAGRDDDRAVGS